MKPQLTISRLREVLHYDPETGLFTWLTEGRVGGARPANRIAGNLNDQGYIQIKVDRKLYAAQRLAWFYMTGEWPPNLVDHEDTIRDNNRWSNLRSATHSQNQQNSKPRPSRSGFKGVTWVRHTDKWMARIVDGKTRRYLGCFETPEEAAAAYAQGSKEYHGEFGRT